AKTLQAGLFAALPSLDAALLHRLIERGLEGEAKGVRPSAVEPARIDVGRQGSDPAAADLIAALLGTAEFPRASEAAGDLRSLLQTDQFRAALGRIASMYDGGHLLE